MTYGAYGLLVTKDNRVILQQRDNKPGIINPGMLTVFGGSLEQGEDFEAGLKREIMEEVGLNIDNYQVKKLGEFRKTVEIDGQDHFGQVFVIKPVDETKLTVYEGAGFVSDKVDNLLRHPKVSRVTRLVLEKFKVSLTV